MKIKEIVLVVILVLGVALLTRPCSMRPLSSHSCHCEGFKEGYGAKVMTKQMVYKYGINCPSNHPD